MRTPRTCLNEFIGWMADTATSPTQKAEIQAYASAIEETGRRLESAQAPALAMDFATEDVAPTAGWRQDEPPKDGSPIMVIGQVHYSYADGGEVVPFSGVIYWPQDAEFADWRFMSNGLTVVEDAPGKIQIDWWTTLPADYVGGVR